MSLKKIEELNKIREKFEQEKDRLLKRLAEQQDQLFKRENIPPILADIIGETRQQLDDIGARIKENEIALIDATEVLRLELNANDRKDRILEKQEGSYKGQTRNYEEQAENYKKQTGNYKEQKAGVHETLVVQKELSAHERWKSAEQKWILFLDALQQGFADIYYYASQNINCRQTVEFFKDKLQSACFSKIPLAKDIFQQHSSRFPTLEYYVDALEYTLCEIRRQEPGHPLCAISKKVDVYLSAVAKLLDSKDITGEIHIQSFYQPFYDILAYILQHLDKGMIGNQVHQVKTVSGSSLTSPCFIKPEKKMDFIVTAPSRTGLDTVVMACMEVKKASKEDKDSFKQLIEAVGGPQWLDYRYHGVKFFFALTASDVSCDMFLMYNKDGEVAGALVHSQQSLSMGVNTLFPMLLAMWFNYQTFCTNLANSIQYSQLHRKYSRETAGAKESKATPAKTEDQYWFITDTRQPLRTYAAIRTFDDCPPQVERSVPENLRALCEESVMDKNWCPFLERAVETVDKMHKNFVVEGDLIMRFAPVGLSPAVVVECIDHVRIMADQGLQALQFLHSKNFVHGSPSLENLVRTSDRQFALLNLAAAQAMSSDDAGMGKALDDVEIFIEDAVVPASDRVIQKLVTQIAADINALKNIMSEECLRRKLSSSRKAVVDLVARKLFLSSFFAQLRSAATKTEKQLTANDVEFVKPASFKSSLVDEKEQKVTLKDLHSKVDSMRTEHDIWEAKDLLLEVLSSEGMVKDLNMIRKAWSNYGTDVPVTGSTIQLGEEVPNKLPLSSDIPDVEMDVGVVSATGSMDQLEEVLNKRPLCSDIPYVETDIEASASMTPETTAAFISRGSTSSQVGVDAERFAVSETVNNSVSAAEGAKSSIVAAKHTEFGPAARKRANAKNVAEPKKRSRKEERPAKKIIAEEREKEKVDANAKKITDTERKKEEKAAAAEQKKKERATEAKRKKQEKAAEADRKKMAGGRAKKIANSKENGKSEGKEKKKIGNTAAVNVTKVMNVKVVMKVMKKAANKRQRKATM